MKDWLQAVQTINSSVYLKSYPLASPGQQKAMNLMISLQETPLGS